MNDPFPLNLRAARTKAGLTQDKAAERLQISRRSLNYWEAGKLVPIYPAQVGAVHLLNQKTKGKTESP